MSTFELKTDLVLPFGKHSFITFPKEYYILTYSIDPNYESKYLNVKVNIVDKESQEIEKVFYKFTIIEQGFPTGIVSNIEDIHAWDINNAALRTELETASEERSAEILNELSILGYKPDPIELYVNKYSQVIDYFNNKGELTEAGIVWAKNLPHFKDII